MSRHEHKTIETDARLPGAHDCLAAKANALGLEGWQLLSVVMDERQALLVGYLKRQLPKKQKAPEPEPEKEPADFGCPRCGAPIGEDCKTGSGAVADDYHAPRKRLARS